MNNSKSTDGTGKAGADILKMKKKMNANRKKNIRNLVITLVVAVLYYYFSLPAINIQNPSLYGYFILLLLLYCVLSINSRKLLRTTADPRELWSAVKQNCKIPLIIAGALIVCFLLGNLVSSPLFRADSYKKLLSVSQGDFAAEVSEIRLSSQIPMLDSASAQRLGDRKMGELADMVSQFEVASDYTQINYGGRPVRTTPLYYGDIIKWLNNRSEGLPAYMIIDMVTQNVDVIRIRDILPGETGIKYSTAEHFGRYLTRHLRFSFPTYMFDDANFEIDEDGVPYWVCPRIVRRIWPFGGVDIQGAVLVNAATGECTYFEEVPTWVDRVYTADLIIKQYDYFGRYQNGFFNSIFGQRDVTVTTDGYNYIAIDDDVYMYTGITSVNSDQSNIGFILTNQRTKETKFYPVAGAAEYSAMDSAQGAVQHLNYVSTFPLLLNISSQPTYFMALKDSAGLVKMYAMVNVEQYQIVATGQSVQECDANYRNQLARNNLAETPVVGSTAEVSGEIEEIRSAVVNGNTQYYIRLAGTEHFYSISVLEAEIAVILSVGDSVVIYLTDDEGDLRLALDIVKR